MSDSYLLVDIAAYNDRPLRALARAIALSENQFSLIVVCCNYLSWREQILQRLQELCSVKTRRLVLPNSAQTLYTTIQNELREEQPPALIVLGLESVLALEELLVSTNHVRDLFRQSFPFPLVLWINDDVVRKLSRLAPDFNNWSPAPISFGIPSHELFDVCLK
ncbi:MAG TPA: hypothetical protein DDZ80_21700 [Cyanobacteria bacterium UBA8803]|nr:hypothetical protein [Cyanobacteria bacterium UBA9273]HBL60950.1 hypothetical protein [Cyanobacteria bacterium UBA8803]